MYGEGSANAQYDPYVLVEMLKPVIGGTAYHQDMVKVWDAQLPLGWFTEAIYRYLQLNPDNWSEYEYW